MASGTTVGGLTISWGYMQWDSMPDYNNSLYNLNEGHLELISLKLTMLPARENCEVVIKFTQIHHDVLCFCSPSVECLADCGIRLFLLLRKYLEAHPTDRRFGE